MFIKRGHCLVCDAKTVRTVRLCTKHFMLWRQSPERKQTYDGALADFARSQNRIEVQSRKATHDANLNPLPA